MIFAVAASILLVVGLSTWAMLRRHDLRIASAVIDLRDRSMVRGMQPPPLELPLEVPRNVSRLEIYLPLASSDGPYDLRISSGRDQPLFSGTGEAKLEQGLTVLRVDLRTSLSNRGRYLLQIRKRSAEWVSFPLEVR
jgi:hypothetical protein